MAKQRTEKSKYPSRYSPNGFVTAAQWVVEFVCEKKAKREKKDLPIQFWKIPEWQTFYRSQVNTANSLIKKHGEKAVIAALRNPKTAWMYSLRAPGFEGFVVDEKRKLDVLASKDTGETRDYDAVDTTVVPREDFRSANLADRLKDL